MGELFNFSDSRSNGINRASRDTPPVSETTSDAPNSGSEQLPPGLPGIDFIAPELDWDANSTRAETSANRPAKVDEKSDRRKRRRASISSPVRVRTVDLTNEGVHEILATVNASRMGILFETSERLYVLDMVLAITFPYATKSRELQAERSGYVVRVTDLPSGRIAVAVAFGERAPESPVDAGGRALESEALTVESTMEQKTAPTSKAPLVLTVDADQTTREMMKIYLSAEGYEVVAVASNDEAREVLKMFTPVLIIAEIEGQGLPGYDLCAHVKSTEHLRQVPVMLLTSSAYPSDYASAHSLGAVICMAKPFRQERLGHVVRLLAPLAHEKEQAAPARPADRSRKHTPSNAVRPVQAKNVQGSRFRLRKWK